jgi:outer membrane protein OmpA-like peptidoglycan-associated protein
MPTRIPRCSLLAAVAASVCLVAPASADEGFALPKFQPSFAGDRLFGVQSPAGGGEHSFFAMVLLDYAHDPLVLRDAATGKSFGAIVSDQVLVHIGLSYALWKAVAFDLDLPVAFQRGEQPMGPNGVPSFGPPSGTALADLRLGARALVVGTADDAFQLALGGLVWFPTGSRTAYTTDGNPRGQPLLIAGGITRWLAWSASVGPELRARVSFPSTTLDTIRNLPEPTVRGAAGIGFLPGDRSFQIGPEVSLGIPYTRHVDKNTASMEVLVGARVRFARKFTTGFAAGLGFVGATTPDFRSLLSLAYTPPGGVHAPEPVDRDGDGILDPEDACPDVKGVPTADPRTNGCPPPPSDRDGDGIPDAEDACPDVPGVRDIVRSLNGCPPDRDNDGIPDSEDACPDQIGPRSSDPKKNGCPVAEGRNGSVDRDGDGIPDDKDACPDDKGPADPDPKKNGCPKDVRVTEGEIVILQPVEFDSNRATIQAVSNPLLDTVAQVLREHPEILKVEVQGHTDSRGVPEDNLKLSQQRAVAVAAALVKRGIEASRVTAKGYGSTHPIMANVTTHGRAKNRRVEFHILERKKR